MGLSSAEKEDDDYIIEIDWILNNRVHGERNTDQMEI